MIRAVGEEAERLGITRPSYERTRQLVHELRALRRRRGPSTAEVFHEAALGVRSYESTLRAVQTPRSERR